ncbi:hypothetical protein GMLC_21100 [Geomonas limicola]|uniref:TOD1/MUCI70 glycosyltransferase-like domain-containing protein n=1 Tax=Geomonas limicola TaxID=2740186 RepID=A0A6V8N7Q8_9BACT|nr:glycosyltransferase domain-containing protein [Geomonas limicola]GFO68531.1 hypothetical protein GMLC_21100 [Geomonas limicola]
MLSNNGHLRVALISADLGGVRGNRTAHYVAQELPEGWSLDVFFFDDATFPQRASLSPRLQAKIPKMLGYELAPGYDFYIWLDSSFILAHPQAVSWLVGVCRDKDLVLFRHPYRTSLGEELAYMQDQMQTGNGYLLERYQSEPVEDQVALYLADQGFRDERLFACGAFVYSGALTAAEYNLLPLWFYHNARYSIQDQLSLPYLVSTLERAGLKVGCFPEGIFTCRYLSHCEVPAAPEQASNVGKWDTWYQGLSQAPGAFRYSDTVTYEMGRDFLADCRVVEDWGTGAGGFKRFRPDAIGVDGSNTPHAEKKYVDLVNYTSPCEGIFMRHVLEHNYQWQAILRNALGSATKKLCIVLFTPLADTSSREIAHNRAHGVDVPDLSLGREELEGILREFQPHSVEMVRIDSETGYGQEYLLYIQK